MGIFDRVFGGKKKQPGDAHDFGRIVEKAMNHVRALTAAHDAAWRLSEADWSVDQDEGTIVFTTPKAIEATAPVQIIGTYNTDDGTWLWGWDHPSVEPALAEHAKRMLAYGREHGIAELTTRKIACTEQRCWELTAAACLICDAQGAYRGPAGSTLVFMTFGEVKLSQPTPPAPRPSQSRPSETESVSLELLKEPAEVVTSFIKCHYEWSTAAYDRYLRSGEDDHSWNLAKEEYAALLSAHCSSTVIPQGISLGSRPSHAPECEAIVSGSIDAGTAVLRTHHRATDGFETNYEYHLAKEDGRWVICQLYYLDEDEKLECL